MSFYWLPFDTIAIVIAGVVLLAGITLLVIGRSGKRWAVRMIGLVVTIVGAIAVAITLGAVFA